jgi:hypothetical protein
MTLANTPHAESEATAVILAFPKSDDWKNIVHHLKLTTTQARELEITIRHVLADIDSYRLAKSKAPPRKVLVAALRRMEKALAVVQAEMERSEHLMKHYLPSNTLEFIGKSFTFTAIQQAVTKGVSAPIFEHGIHGTIGKNGPTRGSGSFPAASIPATPHASNERRSRRSRRPLWTGSTTMEDLEAYYCNERVVLGYKHGGEILKHFIDVIQADLKSWVELDRRNKGGHPANIFRRYIVQRLAERAPLIVGKRATTTAKGKFAELCIAVLPACGFGSKGIEKAIEAVLAKMNERKLESE